jgi:hypothetical protein
MDWTTNKLEINKRTALIAIAQAHRKQLQQHIASLNPA